MTRTNSQDGLLLPGLDGGNPLGFLAALGVIRVLEQELPNSAPTLSWLSKAGTFIPVLRSRDVPFELPDVVKAVVAAALSCELIDEKLCTERDKASPLNKKKEPKWRNKLRFPPVAYRAFARRSIDLPHAADYVSALASAEVIEIIDNQSVAARTPFDFTAGNQAFLAMAAQSLSELHDETAITESLTSWSAPVANAVSLRWDPLDEGRRYALSAFNPQDTGKNPILTHPIANGLAILAMPFFPLIPSGVRVATPCFSNVERRRYFAWPIWVVDLPHPVIGSLLASSGWLIDPESFVARTGVIAVYRSEIVKPSDRYRNFAPAKRII